MHSSRAVRGQTSRSLRPFLPDPGRLRVTIDLARRLALVTHDHRVVVVPREPRCDAARDQRDPALPAVGDAGEQGLRWAALERAHHPASAFVTLGSSHHTTPPPSGVT